MNNNFTTKEKAAMYAVSVIGSVIIHKQTAKKYNGTPYFTIAEKQKLLHDFKKESYIKASVFGFMVPVVYTIIKNGGK